ncbi:MAG: YhcH/YjgK/YiaL family protein [Tannerella sp.]|jgi:YhcH/YjgK/YiaL family protein|nr:YhcH/YjgK/YiaL family protein [Tannerella sp.]
MIVDSLQNSERIECIHPLFKKAFDYVKTTDFSQVADGKVETDDPRLFFSIVNLRGKDPQDATLETHQKYIDIQFPIVGVESIGWKAGEELMIISEVYNEEKDVTFYHDFPTTYTKLYPGQFAIYFPEDAHAPGIGQGDIRKVIAKVAVE